MGYYIVLVLNRFEVQWISVHKEHSAYLGSSPDLAV